jgi:hypothetical protein
MESTLLAFVRTPICLYVALIARIVTLLAYLLIVEGYTCRVVLEYSSDA